MSQATVAVEPPLSPFARALEDAGYRVIPLDEHALKIADAIVIQGMDNHFLGRENPLTRAPVINADGRSPEDVVNEVDRRALIQA
ncbi:MAG: YkuS family protein [Firmicutes bacterium]|nr:YkuS family protein [Bacillota bacterium]